MISRKEKLAVIHIAKKKCRLDDESYRALLQGAAGIESASEMKTEAQYQEILRAFKLLGFRYYERKIWDSQFAKCYALWCELHKAGAVRDRRYSAMRSWMERQIGQEQDMLTKGQKSRLIEDLKAWLERVEGQGDRNSGHDDRKRL